VAAREGAGRFSERKWKHEGVTNLWGEMGSFKGSDLNPRKNRNKSRSKKIRKELKFAGGKEDPRGGKKGGKPRFVEGKADARRKKFRRGRKGFVIPRKGHLKSFLTGRNGGVLDSGEGGGEVRSEGFKKKKNLLGVSSGGKSRTESTWGQGKRRQRSFSSSGKGG